VWAVKDILMQSKLDMEKEGIGNWSKAHPYHALADNSGIVPPCKDSVEGRMEAG
jgi:hypothetical protein